MQIMSNLLYQEFVILIGLANKPFEAFTWLLGLYTVTDHSETT